MPATVILQEGREKSLKRHHPWVFDGAVATVKGRCRSGDTVDVVAADGSWLGRGAYSPSSQIRVRIWTFNQQEVIDNAFFLRRIEQAWQLRQRLMQQANTNACRLIAAESDGLPGVTIDLYNNLAVLQLLSAGADKHRSKIVWALQKLLPDVAIMERSDVDVRTKEGLEPLIQPLHGDIPEEVEIVEHGVKILVNPHTGHKTGFYLDQRENRLAASRYAEQASVLNCFSYTGTFACYALNGGASHVTNVDVSQPALDMASRHIELNGFPPEQCSQVKGDVFEVLRNYHSQQQQFDMVILDPPKFVDSKASLKRACRGYKDINMYGIHAVKPGGILLTFSCSGLMEQSLFQKIVADAALDAGRRVQILEHLSQAPDHPVGLNYPEGYYLKGLVCVVL
ncbi:23S rRNA (cytosine(1962)-C(5))-methyltransferase RlmI [Alteromonas alba]|uniref:23S rRNA (Cytosine(1962)-C(5))-methyltransferase RlmI n=1 Tax=Alteromonas alba TaxID=2079529 RepID=A0A2S9V6R1_9ALTE|nr:class I SAM-dependent methyltransferase [Alteromonas alba]PRO72146.1 23S rRNA (cytosine(1962)-C(5))-methyltransferase RlmI [Alteromonas alba]|tara:strand:- start:789 stop:1976 length:1188 start_codon:yes stop_codon:yes gene_type:complete